MTFLRVLVVSGLMAIGCGGGMWGPHGTDNFTKQEFGVYAGMTYVKEGEVSRWTLINPPAVVEYRPLASFTDHATAAKGVIASQAALGEPAEVKTEEIDLGYTVTGVVWPGTDVHRKAIIIVAEAAKAGGGYTITCAGEVNTAFPQVFGAYCKDLLRPVVRIARGR